MVKDSKREKTYINPYFDMIQLSSEIDTEQYIKNLKENNENIAYLNKTTN